MVCVAWIRSISTGWPEHMDQAAGLREWLASSERGITSAADAPAAGAAEAATDVKTELATEPAAAAPAIRHILMAVGAPGGERDQVEHVRGWLSRWQARGSSWVGDVDSWAVVPVAADSDQLPTLAARAVRWGLWIEDGPSAFRRAFALLIALAENGGPTRLLALHAPGMPRAGLLQNLQQAAEAYLGIELLVLAR